MADKTLLEKQPSHLMPESSQEDLVPSDLSAHEGKDFFVRQDDYEYAGKHLIIDLFGASSLDSLEQMEKALRQAVIASEATLLHIHLHHFTPNGGISGVAVLAESHISVHTWPERQFAAFDVFMCGNAMPEKALPVLEQFFTPSRVEVASYVRGKIKLSPAGSK